MIFSTTSLNTDSTPSAVLAEVSRKREFMRVAKAWASVVGTCRENSLSTLLPTTIRTTEGETYVSSSEYQRGRASKESRLETSYTNITPCAPR